MKTSWWIAAAVIVLAIIGIWWYAQTAQKPEAPQQYVGTTATSTNPAVAEQAVSARDNSDASLNADLTDVNNQLTQLGTDAAAAQ